MKRLIDWHLRTWRKEKRRKPLLLKGARQIGKTYSVRQLGKQFESLVEINFELVPDAITIFEKDLEPERILWELGLLTNEKIIPNKTLLFLDEIQAAPKAILALRYFFELMPELHVIAAGSLIDFAMIALLSSLVGMGLITLVFIQYSGREEIRPGFVLGVAMNITFQVIFQGLNPFATLITKATFVAISVIFAGIYGAKEKEYLKIPVEKKAVPVVEF